MSATGEVELARRAAEGDVAAFAVLVRAHEPTLRRYTRRLAGDDGDDLTQDTVLAAWRAIGQWRGEGTLGPWLRTIATRRFLDRRRTAEGKAQRVDLNDIHRATPHCVDQSIGLAQAMATLLPRERAAALLVFAEGHSHSEAANILQIPLGTLKSLIARARAALIPLLDGDTP